MWCRSSFSALSVAAFAFRASAFALATKQFSGAYSAACAAWQARAPVTSPAATKNLFIAFSSPRLPTERFFPTIDFSLRDQIQIVRIDPRDGEREVTMARWGLIPFWMKEKPKIPDINARAETVHKLPLFREAFAKRRCLIPATGFYEWQQRDDGKQPYRFRRRDLEPFAFAP